MLKSKQLPPEKIKPLRPKKKIGKEDRGYGLKRIAQMTLGSGNIYLLFGVISEYCTPESCPIMSAGPKYEYLWADGTSVKTPLKVSASEYIEYLMIWVENQISKETIFPTQPGIPFPKNFVQTVKVIFKRLFRVYAHIYHTHFQQIMAISMGEHLNTCFKHFIYFIDQFHLVEDKELAPLHELIWQFRQRKNETAENSEKA